MFLSCRSKSTLIIFTTVVSLLSAGSITFASGTGGHPHTEMNNMPMATHQHKAWQKVPAPYKGKIYGKYNEQATIELGGKLYAENCLGCHGKDGKGTGEMAAGLAHPPADLTNHFHCSSGQGDDYLFWRISEGGEVEPFIAMGSAMPAFKDFVSEKQRWAILSYVHASFHAPGSEVCQKPEKSHGHQNQGKNNDLHH